MLSNLPSIGKLKKLLNSLISLFDISNSPHDYYSGGAAKLARAYCLLHYKLAKQDNALKKQVPGTIKLGMRHRLPGDYFAFTILEEGQLACSAKGNHTVAILKVSESYD